MPARISRLGKGDIEIIAWHEGDFPSPPHGYRQLLSEEEPRAGDLAFNVISEQWESITELQLTIVSLFDNPRKMFRYPPVRKKE